MRCSFCVVCLAALVVGCGGTASKRAAEDPVVARDTVASEDSKAGRVSRGEPGAVPGATAAKETPADPRGRFTPSGEPTVVEAFLGPDASWRFLESQITALRAEASALQTDILVEFHEDFFQATVRGGKRTIWRLPKGLRLKPAGRRILLRRDHTSEVSGADGGKIATAGEISVVEATLTDPDGSVRKIQLIVKGGRDFRSIKEAG